MAPYECICPWQRAFYRENFATAYARKVKLVGDTEFYYEIVFDDDSVETLKDRDFHKYWKTGRQEPSYHRHLQLVDIMLQHHISMGRTTPEDFVDTSDEISPLMQNWGTTGEDW